MNRLMEMMDQRRTPREIREVCGCSAMRLWSAAKMWRPDWLEWVYSQIAEDYEQNERRVVVRRWGISEDLMNAVLEATGTPHKLKGPRTRKHETRLEGFSPLAAKAISMKWSPA